MRYAEHASGSMANRTVKLRRLKQILKHYGVEWDQRRGKGSHGSFVKTINGRVFSYPVPDEKDVLICYVKGCRTKFKLTVEDGISDKDFYDA